MPAERRKPRPRKPEPRVSDPDETQPTPSRNPPRRQNLRLSDWLTVFAYIDAHPTLSQTEVVKHFATLASGAQLAFTQPTLSRKLHERADLERRAHDAQRPRVATRPDPHVENALSSWVKRMEENGEQVDGPMLEEQRRALAQLVGVPEEAPPSRVPVQAARPAIPQLTAAERELSEALLGLHARGLIDTIPPLDEVIEPREEREFDLEMAEQNGEVINVDSDDDDDDESGTPAPSVPRAEVIRLCERLEGACLEHSDASSSSLVLGLLSHLRRFRGFLRRKELAQQTTLDDFFAPQNRQSSEPST